MLTMPFYNQLGPRPAAGSNVRNAGDCEHLDKVEDVVEDAGDVLVVCVCACATFDVIHSAHSWVYASWQSHAPKGSVATSSRA